MRNQESTQRHTVVVIMVAPKLGCTMTAKEFTWRVLDVVGDDDPLLKQDV